MQISSIDNTSFQAQIVKSEALKAALEYAQEEAKTGTKIGLKQAEKFYNNLRTMEKDRRVDKFTVEGNPTNFYPYMKFGKNLRLLELYGFTPKDIAIAVIDGVNKLVEGRYLRDQMSDEAKNVDFTKAFERWM